MSIDTVRDAVLERVAPDVEEKAANTRRFERIKDFITEEFDREARLMGSTAKDTFISGDKDLDIFVFFPTDVDENTLEDRGLKIGEAVFEQFDGDYEIDYADHPYTKGHIEDYEVEIIPAYDVDSGAAIRSPVDRTPFHTDWVNEQLTEEQKRDVIVLKAFLRGQGLYGSTLRVEGFSGYLCELLIAEYGSFAALLEATQTWDARQVIDPAERHTTDGKTVLPNFLKQKFEHDGLVVIDPVDPDRNVAAVLSDEKYASFIYDAGRFLTDPREDMFFPDETFPSETDLAEAIAQRGDFVTIAFPTPTQIIDDMLYPQLRSMQDWLAGELERNDFEILDAGFYVGEEETRMVFEFPTAELPAKRKRYGPEVFHGPEHVAAFTEKYEDVWIEDRRLATIIPREHVTAAELLSDRLSGDLEQSGVPDQLIEYVDQHTISDELPVDGESWRSFLKNAVHLC